MITKALLNPFLATLDACVPLVTGAYVSELAVGRSLGDRSDNRSGVDEGSVDNPPFPRRVLERRRAGAVVARLVDREEVVRTEVGRVVGDAIVTEPRAMERSD